MRRVETLFVKTSNPLINTVGGTRAKPVGNLDVEILESPSKEAISQERREIRIKQRSLPADINGQFLSVGVRLVSQTREQNGVRDFLQIQSALVFNIV